MLMSASYRLLELMESRRRNDELKNLRELEAEENRQLIVELQEAEIERPSSGDLEHALASWKQQVVLNNTQVLQ
jgi:hypothetical protein